MLSVKSSGKVSIFLSNNSSCRKGTSSFGGKRSPFAILREVSVRAAYFKDSCLDVAIVEVASRVAVLGSSRRRRRFSVLRSPRCYSNFWSIASKLDAISRLRWRQIKVGKRCSMTGVEVWDNQGTHVSISRDYSTKPFKMRVTLALISLHGQDKLERRGRQYSKNFHT